MKLFKNIFLRGLYVLLQLIFIKVIIFFLSPDDLGLYYLYMTAVMFIQVLYYTPSLINYQREYSKTKINAYNFLSSNFNSQLLVTAVFVVLSILIFELGNSMHFEFLNDISYTGILIFILYSYFQNAYNFINTYYSLKGEASKYYLLSVLEILIRVFCICFVGALYHLTPEILGSTLCVSIILTYLLLNFEDNLNFKAFKPHLNGEFRLSSALTFNSKEKHLRFGTVLYFLQNNIYRLVLLKSSDISYFGIAMSIISLGQQLISQVINVIHNSYLPEIIDARYFRRNILIVLVGFILFISLIYYFLYPELIPILFNASFVPFYYFLFVALVYEFFNYWSGLHSLSVINVTHRYSISMLVSFSAIICLTYVLYFSFKPEYLALILFTISPILTLLSLQLFANDKSD